MKLDEKDKRDIAIIIGIIILFLLILFIAFNSFDAGYRQGYLYCIKNFSLMKIDYTNIPKN